MNEHEFNYNLDSHSYDSHDVQQIQSTDLPVDYSQNAYDNALQQDYSHEQSWTQDNNLDNLTHNWNDTQYNDYSSYGEVDSYSNIYDSEVVDINYHFYDNHNNSSWHNAYLEDTQRSGDSKSEYLSEALKEEQKAQENRSWYDHYHEKAESSRHDKNYDSARYFDEKALQEQKLAEGHQHKAQDYRDKANRND